MTGVVNALKRVDDSMEETPLVDRAVYPPVRDKRVSDCRIYRGGNVWSRGRGEGSEKTRHTKQSNQAQVDQDRPVPVSRAGPHQEDNQHAAHHKIQFELHGRYGVPDVVRRQLRLLLVRAEHDGDGARDRDDDAPEVPLPEYLLEQDGRDHTVGDQRHDAQGADNRRGREPVGEEIADRKSVV